MCAWSNFRTNADDALKYAFGQMQLMGRSNKSFVEHCISCRPMSGRHSEYDRYGHSQWHQQQQQPQQQQQQQQQQHKRHRDDGDRDQRGPRQCTDLRGSLSRDSWRPNVPRPGTELQGAGPASSPLAVDPIMAARGIAAVDWELTYGFLKKDEDYKPAHMPVSLRPVPFPRSIFNHLYDIHSTMQQL